MSKPSTRIVDALRSLLERLKGLDPAKLLFFAAAVVLLFAWGFFTATTKRFPYRLIRAGLDAVTEVFADRGMILGTRPTAFLAPARYQGSGVTRRSSGMVPGLTLITGFFGDGNEIRLIQPDGKLVRRWTARYFDYFPKPNHLRPGEVPKSEWNAEPHGAELLPDGSIIFNFNYLGTVKLDRCGKVEWVLARRGHHKPALAAGGGFWIQDMRHVDGKPEYGYLKTPYQEDMILRVSEDGRVMKEIRLLKVMHDNGIEGMNFRLVSGDVIHLNDLEELGESMAGAFPELAAGDLMVSLRFNDVVFVMDPATLRIKWYQRGPWKGQHDPDFLADGRIRVFSNNYDGNEIRTSLGGSTLIDVDPRTRAISYRYGPDDPPMFTAHSGEQQTFENGNVLVAESHAGRVFEVTRDGTVVWEFINRYDEESLAFISGASRYPEEYFSVKDWACSK